MRKHMTQAELLRIERLLASGVTDKAEIQKQVFVHSDCIDQVIKKQADIAAAKEAEAKKPPKKQTAAEKAKAKAAAAEKVDPLS